MRVAVVFPPSICLPNQIYYSLPMLAGALRRGGHDPRCVDLNSVAADLLLDRRRVEHFVRIADELIASERQRGNRSVADTMRRNIDVALPLVTQGEECKRALRDPSRFYDQPTFQYSFWSIVDILAFFYQLDPVISPFRDTFAADMLDNQHRDRWSTVLELYDHGLLDEVFRDDPEMVAISVAFPEQAVEAVRLARKVRQRNPGVHISMGGPLMSSFPDKWLEDGWLFDFCDSVGLGDGETAIVELCDALEGRGSLDSVRNLAFRNSRGEVCRPTEKFFESMDELPVPDFGSADMERYFLPEPIYPLMTSRGCYWGRCSFCSTGWRDNYRMASKEKLRADVLEVSKRYGGRFVQLQDSSLPPKAGTNLSTVIREEGVEMHWVTGMKFERCFLDREYCEHIGGDGGCRSLLMGFESYDQRLLDLMNKGYQLPDLPAMLHNLRDAGISAELLWFIGFPSQTRKDVLDTARFLYERRGEFGLTAFVGDYYLHPDTEVFKRPQDFGVVVTGQDNGRCVYEVEHGLTMQDSAALKQMLAGNNNRTLTCNGSHMPHLAVSGLDLSGVGRPATVPPEVVEFCTSGGSAADEG